MPPIPLILIAAGVAVAAITYLKEKDNDGKGTQSGSDKRGSDRGSESPADSDQSSGPSLTPKTIQQKGTQDEISSDRSGIRSIRTNQSGDDLRSESEPTTEVDAGEAGKQRVNDPVDEAVDQAITEHTQKET